MRRLALAVAGKARQDPQPELPCELPPFDELPCDDPPWDELPCELPPRDDRKPGLGKEGALVKSLMTLKVDANTPINGRPRSIGNPVEIPLADTLKYDASKGAFDGNGLDTESIVFDAKNKVF